MKKVLISVLLLILYCSGPVWSGGIEGTLKKMKQGYAEAQGKLGLMYATGNGITQDYKQAFYHFKKAAEQGNVEAQHYLGLMYENGHWVAQDYKQAFYWYKKVAEQGVAIAQHTVGWMYWNGKGVTQDHKEAIYWWDTSAKLDYADAQRDLGSVYCFGADAVPKDYKKSFYWFKKAAEQDDIFAQILIAWMYYSGRGTLPDLKQYIYWENKVREKSDQNSLNYQKLAQDNKQTVSLLKNSAEQDDVFAQVILGVMYEDGKVTPKDIKLATFWIKKAANRGNALAQAYLGGLYSYDNGAIPKNYKKSFYWLKKATEQKDTFSYFILGEMYYDGEGGFPKDYKKSFYWYKKAAEQGFVDAQEKLGEMYYDGEGVPKDYKKSFFWYEKIAEQGKIPFQLVKMYYYGKGTSRDYKQALYWAKQMGEDHLYHVWYMLVDMYSTGKGTPQDWEQAEYYVKKADENNWGFIMGVGAPCELGYIYYNGKELPKDYKKSFFWYKKAAEQGSTFAQTSLGLMYYYGEGVAQNYKLAYLWENIAAAQGVNDAIRNRDIIAKKLTPQQLSEAQDLAAKIQYKIDHPTESIEQQASKSKKAIKGSGTGFIITKDGYILTCHHVIKNSSEIKISIEGEIYPAKLVLDDPNNDLALLKINGSFSAIAFSSKRSAKMGQEVFTIGYPNPRLQGVNAKYTEGSISSLTGFQDDLRLYQISVPVQPGNSGGALVDENGNILGVIVAMLSAKTTFKISGSLPQNVNYAVKSIYAQAMLDSLPEISDKLIPPSNNKSNAISRVTNSTVVILSYE